MRKGLLLFISSVAILIFVFATYSTCHNILPLGNTSSCINDRVELDCKSVCMMDQVQIDYSIETEEVNSYLVDINEGVQLEEDETLVFSVKYLNYLLKYSDMPDVSASEIISDLIR